MFSTKLRDAMLFVSSNFWQLVRLPVCMSVCSPLAWSQCVKCDFSYRHSNARNNSNSELEGFKAQVEIRDDTEQSYCKKKKCLRILHLNEPNRVIIMVCPWPFGEEPHFKGDISEDVYVIDFGTLIFSVASIPWVFMTDMTSANYFIQVPPDYNGGQIYVCPEWEFS